MISLSRSLWTGFGYEFSELAVARVESSLIFLAECLEMCLDDVDEEQIRINLELDLLIYLGYFSEADRALGLSRWLLHDAWFRGWAEAEHLSDPMRTVLRNEASTSTLSARADGERIIRLLQAHPLICSESDAAAWLCGIDALVSKLVSDIVRWRLDLFLSDPPRGAN